LEGTLLQIAIANQDKKLFAFLLARGANPNIAPRWSFDLNVLSQIVDSAWRNDWSKEETLEFAQLALDSGADVNQHGMHGFTPLSYAVSWELTDLAELFLDNGGLIKEKDAKGWDSMDMASFRSNKQLVGLLVRHNGEYTVQEAVCIGQETDVVNFLKSDPSVVRDSFIEGNSLLGLALSRGHLSISRHLIEAGADLAHLNTAQDSVLHLAAQGGNADLVKLLIEQGLDVNARNASRSTPLHQTTFSDREEAAKVLIAAKADVDAQNSSGISPTLWASSYDSPNVLKLLLEAGCDPNQRGAGDGTTPLGTACHYSNLGTVPDCVKVLVASGADVNRIGSKGRPCIHWAVAWAGGVPLVQYLLDHGADPMIRDSSGETAMDIARREQKTQVLQVLGQGNRQPSQRKNAADKK
jgi:ankyrin repeat protein